MSWAAAAPAIVSAGLAVLAPGLVATAPLRMAVLARIAIAPLVGVCCVGAAAVVSGAAGLPFHLVQVMAVALAGMAVSLLLRRRLAIPGRPGPSRPPLAAKPLLTMWAVAAAMIAVVAFSGVPDPSRISQTYDNVFHLSAVAAILDGFPASPLTLRALIETGASGLAYYPSAWHALVVMTAQGSGADPAVAFNALWLAVQTLVWLPGVAYLARVALPGRSPATTALAALPLAAAFGMFPYALLAWGTIYPTGLAHALLPSAVAVTVVAVRGVASPGRGARRRAALLGVVGFVLVMGGLSVAHPRVLPTWLLLVLPFVAGVLVSSFRRAWRRGGRSRHGAVAAAATSTVVGIVVAVAALAFAVTRVGLLDEPIADRLSGPQARAVQGLGDGVLQVLTMRSLTGDGGVTAPAPLLALLVVLGALAAFRARRTRWMVVALVLIAALFVLAAGSDGVVAKLATGIWYKDRFRLAAALPVVAAPLAALGALALARMLARVRRPRWAAREAATGPAIALVVAIVSAAGLVATGTTSAIAGAFALPADRAEHAVVSQRQIDFLRGPVADTVPADQRVLGDPWDGSALTLLLAGREPVFPHVNGQWDPARLTLAWHLADIEHDPGVCRALDELRVRFVLYDPHALAGGDPAGDHFPGPHEAVEAGLFTPVATDGRSSLYRIEQCGPLPAR